MIDRLKMLIPISFLILIILVSYVGYKFFVLNTGDNDFMTIPYIGRDTSNEHYWIKCDISYNGICFGWKENIPEELIDLSTNKK